MSEKTIKPYTPFQEWLGLKFIKNYAKYQVFLYEKSGGRFGKHFLGAPCCILTTTGRKTGKQRKSPLLYLEEADRVYMAATKGGMSTAPDWYLNLQVHPDCTVQIGDSKRLMSARTATPAEAEQIWPKLDQMYSGYAEYRQRLQGVRTPAVIIFEDQNKPN